MPRKRTTDLPVYVDEAAFRKRRGPVPGTDNARRGGLAVREKYGTDYYRAIGRKGGATVRTQRGPEFYAEIGRRGGQSTKRLHGLDFYQRIGQRGGTRATQRDTGNTTR